MLRVRQVTTYLGVPAEDFVVESKMLSGKLLSSILATDPKRQYRRMMTSHIAVLIQEMLTSQSAGITFTCNV